MHTMVFDSIDEMQQYVDDHPEVSSFTQWDNPQIEDSTKEIAKFEEENGFDGVIFRNISNEGRYARGYTGDTSVYVVFSPNQIKSVDNRGTFDPENPNIDYQTGVKEIDSREPFLKERENGPKIADDNEPVEVVKIPEDSIPDFETKVQLRKWLVSEFEKLGSVMIKSTSRV